MSDELEWSRINGGRHVDSEEEEEEERGSVLTAGGDDDAGDDDDDEEESCERESSTVLEPESPGGRRSSYSNLWPQSFRESIDRRSSFTALGTSPLLNRLSRSFLNSSSSSLFHEDASDRIISSVVKPLLPTTGDHIARQQQITGIKKSSSDHGLVAAVPRRSSRMQAVFNGVNYMCGVGILSMPYAIKEGGWIGLSIMFVFAVLGLYTGILLRRCLDSEEGIETYPDIGHAAFGMAGRIIVSIALYVELYACCIEYVILESDNLSSLFPDAQLSIGGLHITSKVFFAILTTLVVLPTTWLRDLSLLSYISAGGVVASILVVVCLLWVGVEQVGFHGGGSTLLDIPGIPIAIGLYGYCYSGHAVIPNIYSSLQNKSQYPFILLISFGICTVLYAAAAIFGYSMFGEATESQFTLNLPHNLVSSNIAVWTTVVNPITKYALTITPLALSLEELMRSKSHLNSIIIRTFLVISTLLVALSVPFFGLVMALVGSLLSMLVSFILPCSCFLKIAKGKVSYTQGMMCSLIIAVGAVCCGVGTVSSLTKIIQSLS